MDYSMTEKPTYTELLQKVHSLEKKVAEHARIEAALQKNTHDLEERIKELNCLYRISSLREKKNLSLSDTLQGIVDLLPPSWQYPEITCARITREGDIYVTDNYRETHWQQASDVKVHGKIVGQVVVFYLEGKPELDEGPFLKEERHLIDAVSERLGRIVEREIADRALRTALEESQQRQKEISALLKGANAVLEYREFEDVARIIFDVCKDLIGAPAGYVALQSKDGKENELLFLESGGLPCAVDPDLPMPIRGLRGETYRTGRAVFHNDFSQSRWIGFMPEGHVQLNNVLFAPLVIKGRPSGLLGLANKPGGFTENDCTIATAFGELAAIALHNSRTLASLEDSEKRVRSVVETASDAIISIDSKGDIVFWNQGAETMFGYPPDAVIGKAVTLIMPNRFRETHLRQMGRLESTGRPRNMEKPIELFGLREDGSEFPIELMLDKWSTKEGVYFTGIIRDITERKLAEEALRNTQDKLEQRVQERTAELSKANEELQRLSARLLEAHEEESKRIGRELHDGLAQTLSAIKVWVESALLQISQKRQPEDLMRSLDSVVDLTQRAVEDIRRISRNLRPSVLDDLGILATISWLCQEFEEIYSGIRIEKRIHIGENDVPDALKIVIFRILQESLNNIAKHSHADFSQVSLEKRNGRIELTINDNGTGIDLTEMPPDEQSERGLGLDSMKERSKLSGGSFSVESDNGIGTTVRASWPI